MQKKIKNTEQEWQSELSAESYFGTRQKGTENSFENSYHDEKFVGSTTTSVDARPHLIQTINLPMELDGQAP